MRDTLLHEVAGNDVCDNGFIMRDVALNVAHGKIGSFQPVKVDGVSGHFEYVSIDSTVTRFVPHPVRDRIVCGEQP